MKVIGLCGGSGSGKGVVCSLFNKFGIPAIDTDAVYRELTSADGPCNRSLCEEFGMEIISEDGSLNRKALGKIVFTGEGAEKRLKKLNEIAHKFILDKTRLILDDFKNQGVRAAIVDAPVLFESGFDSECDVTIAVIADREIRIGRIIARDKIDRESAEARIASQLSDEELISRSSIIIENNSNLLDLEKRVSEVANLLLNN